MSDWLNHIKSFGNPNLELRAVTLFEEFKNVVVKAHIDNPGEYTDNMFDRLMHLFKTTERTYCVGPHDGVIDSFFGPYRFLSNFEPCTVEYDGMTYNCSEAAYQAAKTTDVSLRIAFTSRIYSLRERVSYNLHSGRSTHMVDGEDLSVNLAATGLFPATQDNYYAFLIAQYKRSG